MRISSLILQPRVLLENIKTHALRQLQPGQQLQAQVTAQADKNLLLLKIGNNQVTARTNVSVAIGQQLSLEVIEASKQPVLKIIPPLSVADIIANTIKNTLPKQQSLADFFQYLSKNSPPNTSPEIHALLKNILSQNISRKTLNSRQIKQLIQQSGLFLEAKLAQKIPVEKDLKMDLLKLITLLKPVLAESTDKPNTQQKQIQQIALEKSSLELLQQTKAALAGIKTRQLSSIRLLPDATPEWRLEIPLQQRQSAQNVQLNIRRNNKRNVQQQSIWAATLEINLPELGALRVGIQLEGDQVNCQFSSVRQQTNQKITEQLEHFAQALQKAALLPGTLKSQVCNELRPNPIRRLPNPLLDEQA